MKRHGSLHIVILLLAILLGLFRGLYYWSDTIDDAYISFRYAANLAAGEGLVFNPGERVEGFSNLLWTLGTALFILIGADPMLAAKLAGLAAAVLTLVVLDRLLARTVDGYAARLAGLALAVLAVPSAYWSVQGMETPLFTLLLSLAFWRFGEELERDDGFPWSAVLFVLACLTRPEGPLYLAVFAGARLARGGRRWRQDLHWLLVYLVPMAVHLVWRRIYYGELLPNTYFAKGMAGAGFLSFEARSGGLGYIGSFLSGTWGLPALFGALGLLVVGAAFLSRIGPDASSAGERRIRRSRLLLPVLWLAAALFFAWHANGDWMPNARFLAPAVPALALLVAMGIDLIAGWAAALARHLGRRSDGAAPARAPARVVAVVVSSLLAALLVAATLAEAGVERRTGSFNFSGGQHPRLLPMAMALMETLRDGETVVYGDIGIVGYLNPEIRIIDNRGLVHRTMARLLFNRPHRMDEVGRLRAAFLEEFSRIRPEAAVVVVNRKARAPVWQTEIFALHPGFQRNYAETQRLTHRRVNTEVICLRRDLVRRQLGPDEVIAHYRRAIELAPRVSDLYIRLTEICGAAGRMDVRRETMEAASRCFAGDQTIRRRLEAAGR